MFWSAMSFSNTSCIICSLLVFSVMFDLTCRCAAALSKEMTNGRWSKNSAPKKIRQTCQQFFCNHIRYEISIPRLFEMARQKLQFPFSSTIDNTNVRTTLYPRWSRPWIVNQWRLIWASSTKPVPHDSHYHSSSIPWNVDVFLSFRSCSIVQLHLLTSSWQSADSWGRLRR